jgi:hypothetical protein
MKRHACLLILVGMFRRERPDYDEACRHFDDGRREELARLDPANNRTAAMAQRLGYPTAHMHARGNRLAGQFSVAFLPPC